MIFEIKHSIITDKDLYVEKKTYQALDLSDLFESCGFTNFSVECAGGYDNCIVFSDDQ